jgi:hypothetical protein
MSFCIDLVKSHYLRHGWNCRHLDLSVFHDFSQYSRVLRVDIFHSQLPVGMNREQKSHTEEKETNRGREKMKLWEERSRKLGEERKREK